MSWINTRETVVAVCGVLGLAIAYLGLATQLHWWPLSNSGDISITTPTEGYQFASDFTVEMAGGLPSESRLWVVAIDSTRSVYPLAEAVPASENHWRAVVHAEQIISPVSLCAVTSDTTGAESLLNSMNSGRPLPGLPPGSKQSDCRNVQPARR